MAVLWLILLIIVVLQGVASSFEHVDLSLQCKVLAVGSIQVGCAPVLVKCISLLTNFNITAQPLWLCLLGCRSSHAQTPWAHIR
jgi:hypothetical protein